MEFTLDKQTILEHVVLMSGDAAVAEIAKTAKWQEDEKLQAKLTINGVEVPAETLEKVLEMMWEQANEKVGNRDYERDVHKKAIELVQNLSYEVTNKVQLWSSEDD